MKTGNFTACHKAVSPDSYIEACQQETCLCKFGGDCACFCAAVGAYVQECNRVGIPVYWRREGLCSKCLPSISLPDSPMLIQNLLQIQHWRIDG